MDYSSGPVLNPPYNKPQFRQSSSSFRRNIYVPPVNESQLLSSPNRLYRLDPNTPISPAVSPLPNYSSFQQHQTSFELHHRDRKFGSDFVTSGARSSTSIPHGYGEASLQVCDAHDDEDDVAEAGTTSGSSTRTRKSVEADSAKQRELLFLAKELMSQEPVNSSRRKPLSSVIFAESNRNRAATTSHHNVHSRVASGGQSSLSLQCTGTSDYGPLLSATDAEPNHAVSTVSEALSHAVVYPDREKLLAKDDNEDSEVLWQFEPMSPLHQDDNYAAPNAADRYRVEDCDNNNNRGWIHDPSVPGQQSGDAGCCGFILMICSYLIIFLTLPFSLCLTIKVVQEYERAVIFRLGRLLPGGAKGPGLFFIIPCMDSYTKVDIRTVSFDVPPQEVLSKDSVTVAVDAVVYYRVHNATVSVTNVEDFSRSTRLLAATTLRNVLGTKNLSEILSEREAISHLMQSSLDEATDPWGVKVERVEIKDVRLPVQLQRAMAAEAEAAREARAKVIAAEGEEKASRALKDAADIINESPAALQLRYLQTLNTISAEKNSTIIFPLPMDFLKTFVK